jgi:hypothetical protein
MTILTTAITKLSPVFAKAAKRVAIKVGKAAAALILGEIIDSLTVMAAKRLELKDGEHAAGQAFKRVAQRAMKTGNEELKKYVEKISPEQSQPKFAGARP